MTRAAVRAYMSLPAASVRIKNLEDMIGARLINRDNAGIRLSPPGQALLRHARLVLAQLENLRGDMQEYVQGIKSHVRILANTTATAEFLPAVLRSFLVSHPDVNIDLREHLSNDVVRAVSEGGADIGCRGQRAQRKPAGDPLSRRQAGGGHRGWPSAGRV